MFIIISYINCVHLGNRHYTGVGVALCAALAVGVARVEVVVAIVVVIVDIDILGENLSELLLTINAE